MNEGQDTNSGLGGAGDRLDFEGQNVMPSQMSAMSQQSIGSAQMTNTMQPTGLMSSTQPMQQSVSSGTGDIVLAPEKKSRKGFIIAMVVAFLLAGGLLVTAFLLPRLGGNAGVSGDVKMAFNRYANYLLYGMDSDEELEGEYSENEIYEFDKMRSDDQDVVSEYFETADELLSKFESLAYNSRNNELILAVSDYRGEFDIARMTFDGDLISDDVLLTEVMNNDLETVDKWIDAKFVNLSGSENEQVKEYIEAEKKYYKLYAEYLGKLKEAGCLSGDSEVICNNDDMKKLDSEVGSAYSVARDYVSSAQGLVLSDCWTIDEFLNGGDEE